MNSDIWLVLGIEPTKDVAAIRRAYASMLKRTPPDDDPAGFARLREAYEYTLRLARVSAAGLPRPAPSVVAPPPAAESLENADHTVPVAAPAPVEAFETPAEIGQLRAAFQALQQAVAAIPPADSRTLESLLQIGRAHV